MTTTLIEQCTYSTTDTELRSITQTTRRIGHCKTCNCTLHTRTNVGKRTSFELIFHTHRTYRTCQIGFALSIITYYDHFIQETRVFFEYDINGCTVFSSQSVIPVFSSEVSVMSINGTLTRLTLSLSSG